MVILSPNIDKLTYNNTINSLNDSVFKLIGESLDELKLEGYVIGGYVRDYFLKRPSKDIDIVVVGSGIALAQRVAAKIGRDKKVNVFKNFGTAQLVFNNIEIEFVGARKESYQRTSRNPVVEEGSLQDDQNRRDFTINAMAFCLNKQHYGQLVDPFGGMTDLQQSLIRTPLDPDTTYSDDPLRMLRAIRFAAQLSFTIQDTSFEAIKRNKERIKIISAERIADELNKIILASTPSHGFYLLDKSGLLEIIFPELTAMKGVEKVGKQAHKDNFIHTLQVLDNVAEKSNDLWLRWAAILHDIAKPRTKKFDPVQGWTFHGHDAIGVHMVKRIFKRMKLPLSTSLKFVQKMVGLHLRPIALAKDEVTDSAIRRLLFEAGNDIENLMTLCEADITSANDSKVKRYLKNFRLVRNKLVEIEEKDAIRNFQPPVSGDEIIKTFNLIPGPEIGVIKNAIKEAILDGVIANNYTDAVNFMHKKAKELGLE